MRKEMEAEFNLLKRTYLERGINGMTPRDSVELLLFFAGIEDPIMLMRTLFEKFRSPDKILNAGKKDLMACEGMTETAAELITALPTVFTVAKTSLMMSGRRLDVPENAERYFKLQFGSPAVEQFRFCCLDKDYSAICCMTPSMGDGVSVEVSADELIKTARQYVSTAMIVAHNHPSGSRYPSQDDVDSTQALKEALAKAGIKLLNHVIIGRDGVYSMGA